MASYGDKARRHPIQNIADAIHLARRRLPLGLYQMVEGGTGLGVTARENERAFQDIEFLPKAAVYHPARDQATSLLGHPLSVPFVVAPTGGAGLLHRHGEKGIARAAGAAGTIQCVSSLTNTPIEAIAGAASGPLFYQLYFSGGRAADEHRIERARQAGCKALILTVDCDRWVKRERRIGQRADMPVDMRLPTLARFAPQVIGRPAWALDFLRGHIRPRAPMILDDRGRPQPLSTALIERAPVWDDIKWVRDLWKGPVIVKGIVRPDDARRAVDEGAAAIVVSNHGGNAIDGGVATIRALPDVVAAVGGQCEIVMDGGIRRGADIVKALALGARAVLVGRAVAYGLAAQGEAGVTRMLDILRDDVDSALGLLGCRSIHDLDRSFIRYRQVGGGAELPSE